MKKIVIFFEPEVYSYAIFWAHSSITYYLLQNTNQTKPVLYLYIFNRIPGACLFQNIPKNSPLVGRIAEGKEMLKISCTLFLALPVRFFLSFCITIIKRFLGHFFTLNFFSQPTMNFVSNPPAHTVICLDNFLCDNFFLVFKKLLTKTLERD